MMAVMTDMKQLTRVLLASWLLALAGAASAQEFLPVDEALEISAYRSGPELVVDWTLAPEHYMYRRVTAIQLAADNTNTEAALGELVLSNHHQSRYDPTFDEEMSVYYDFLTARIPVRADQPVSLAVTYQGCAEAGLCYPPQTRTVNFDPNGEATLVPARAAAASPRTTDPSSAGQAASPALPGYDSGRLAAYLGEASLGWTLLLFVALGIGLVFTPCVLPMIPIASALVLGSNRPSTPVAFVVASAYVAGMALTYALLGVAAAALGAAGNFQAAVQQPWVLTLFAGLFAFLALAMFGVFNLQTPGPLQQALVTLQNRLQQGRVGSAFGVGALSALVVSPCVTAPLAAALIYISATGNLWHGFLTLFALGLGMGLPLILVAVGGARWLPTRGAWMNQVKVLFGVLLLGVAIWLLGRWLAGPVTLVLWAALALGYGSWWLSHARAGARGWLARAAGIAGLVYGGAALTGALAGNSDPLRPLISLGPGTSGAVTAQAALFHTTTQVPELEQRIAQAQAGGEPVLLDVAADWCVSCKVMERTIYAQPDVQAQLDDHRWLRLDITDFNTSHQAWLDRHNLFGPPAILQFMPDDGKAPSHKLIGELTKEQFQQRLGLI